MMKISKTLRIGSWPVKNPVVTAPLAGITDKIFRGILAEMGAGLTFTEMVCAKALIYQNKKTRAIMDITGEDNCGIQIFGADPREMATAAKMAAANGAPVIDLNMGCPVPKVVNNREGSALLRDIPLALRITEAAAQAVDVPVTVKLRKGFAGEGAGLALAKLLPEAGAQAITVHGRDRTAYYSGKADWNAIKEIKENVKIPVIGNGDIFTPEDAIAMLEFTGCDGVMLARGVLGNPWLVRDTVALLQGQTVPPSPTPAERAALAIRHLEESCELYDQWQGIRYMRKFLGWYIKGFRDAAKRRRQINTLTDKEEIKALLWEIGNRDAADSVWDTSVPPEV